MSRKPFEETFWKPQSNLLINPFQVDVPFLYSLIMSENPSHHGHFRNLYLKKTYERFYVFWDTTKKCRNESLKEFLF